jgi:hypothetical protein
MKQPKKKPAPQKIVPEPVKINPAKGWKPSSFQIDMMVIGFFALVVIALHWPIFLNSKLYDGGDSHEALVKTNMINQYYDQAGDVPRWNPYPEAGIPNVFFLPKPPFSPDFFLAKMGDAIGISIVYLLIGVIGMYFLLKYLKFGLIISIICALSFILAPYYKSLIIVGQYLPTKFEAVMIIPWIVLTFLLLLDKVKLVYACLFSFVLSVQFLTQHYQVIYYTCFLLLAIGIYPLYRLLKEKHYQFFAVKSVSIILALIFALVLVAYPLFVSKKFNDASLRATWGLDITKPVTSVTTGSGVSKDFIDQWSPATRELTDLLVPAASGGSTREMYKGSEAPQLSGTQVPAYWGKMTFSFSYLYFGLAVLIALVGLFFHRNSFVISLGIFGFLLTLWSLGTTLDSFYMFFYDYLPFFKNFRTPPTSMTVVYFILSVLSAYGLQFLFKDRAEQSKEYRRKLFASIGAFLMLGLFIYLAASSFNYVKTGENYEAGYMDMLKLARKEMFLTDLGRYFLLVGILGVIITAYVFRAIRQRIALIACGLLLIIDLVLVNDRYTNELLDAEAVRQRYFPAKPLTDFFKADPSVYRVFPVTDRGRDLSAVVPIIGDHDLQVLTKVYEINTNNLYQNIDSITNINWNVLKIFGVKYFVCDREVFHPKLGLVFSDPPNKDYVYRFADFTSFGHFVERNSVIPGAYERLKMINNAAFDPIVTAMLEKDIQIPLHSPDSSYSTVNRFTPNEMDFDVYTDKQSLFVIPIPFVKDGWEFMIDDKKADEVYITNHAVQSLVIPPGNHKVRARFNSTSFTTSYWISAIAYILLYGLLIYIAVKRWRNTMDKTKTPTS